MEEKNSGKFPNGFLLGLVVGGALVFLFGTRKGRKLLKGLSDEGLDVLENIENIEEINTYDVKEPNDVKEKKEEDKVHSSNGHGLKKRFFRGIRKK